MGMGLLSRVTSEKCYGLVIDIGSGSVSAAIVCSNKSKAEPVVIWSEKVLTAVKTDANQEQQAKAILAALMNVMMKFDTAGRSKLNESNSSANLQRVEVAVSAPWAQTVTRNISYSEPEPFKITDSFISKLVVEADKKIKDELSEDDVLENYGLQVVARATHKLKANGYSVVSLDGRQAKQVDMSRTTVVVPDFLYDSLQEIKHKLFPNLSMRIHSFMYSYYCMTIAIPSFANNVCLIDVTAAATEVGVVREGILEFTDSAPLGSHTLVQEITDVLGVSEAEVHGYLSHEQPLEFFSKKSKAIQNKINKIFGHYSASLSDTLSSTGNSLSLPKTILLNAELSEKALYTKLIKDSASTVYLTEPTICWTNDIATDFDSRIWLASQFFHKPNHCLHFDYV